MIETEKFAQDCANEIRQMGEDRELQRLTSQWIAKANSLKYSYHFNWQGRPIIQYPQDIVAMQEIIWEVRPDLIIETGIAHGGSLIFSASMLALLDLYDCIEQGTKVDGTTSGRCVLGVDIDIRKHNRSAIDKHPLRSRISMIEGSSIDKTTVAQVKEFASGYERILVCLDSNHTHDHVLAELEAYADLTSIGSYCVVFDTIVEDLPADNFGDRPWGIGDNPKTAVHKFLKTNDQFEIDETYNSKLQISVAPDGFLKRVKK